VLASARPGLAMGLDRRALVSGHDLPKRPV
jgi:hypothetical protein